MTNATLAPALEGFSPVSYFEKGIAEQGDPRYAVTHGGVTYHLASPQQVQTFKADPEKYVPAYNGWCAYGCAIDKKFPVDPHNFKLVNGRLFLFLKNADIDAREKWSEGDEIELTRKADAYWGDAGRAIEDTFAMPAGRPPDPELIERLLDVTTDLFYRNGIRAVGVDEIAERSGVAKRSIYRHYRTKDDLIAAVIRRRDQRWRDEFFAAVKSRAHSPKQRLLAAFDLLGETCRTKGFRGCPFINAAIELSDARHPGHAAVVENKRATRAFFVELLRAAKVASPHATGDEFMLLFNGALVNCALEADDTPARRAKEAAQRLIHRPGK